MLRVHRLFLSWMRLWGFLLCATCMLYHKRLLFCFLCIDGVPQMAGGLEHIHGVESIGDRGDT